MYQCYRVYQQLEDDGIFHHRLPPSSASATGRARQFSSPGRTDTVIIVYNNELQIKFEFHRYGSIFDRVVARGLSQVC
jgi:hypothetical protein